MSKATDWDIVFHQATIAQQEPHRIWQSFRRGYEYCIQAINENEITIERLNGTQNVTLTPRSVNNAIETLKRGAVLRGQLMGGIVAKERALIELHPNISWDEHTDNISWGD